MLAPVLKPALQLLQLIEDRRYSDAVNFVRNNGGEGSNLGRLSPDLIYKVAYSFGNESNSQLNLLLVELFQLMKSETEKYELCFELLTWRTSPFLAEILLHQLESLINENFQEQYPNLCNRLCNELPKKVERRLCERLMSEDEDLGLAITEAACILAFFNGIPLKVSHRFDRLIDDVLSKIPFDEAAAFPFLTWHSRAHPFCPRLLGLTEPTVLIPSVYDQNYLLLRLAEGINEYVSGKEQRGGNAVKPLMKALGFLFKLSEECQVIHSSFLNICSDMFVSLLRFIDDLDSEIDRLEVMKISQDIMSGVPIEFRALLIKSIITTIVSGGSLCPKYEPNFLSWLLDQFEKNVIEKAFANEVGSVLGVLEDVTYSQTNGAPSFYSSLLRLLRTLAHDCINTPLLAEARERLVQRIHVHLKKCLRYDPTDGITATTGDEADLLMKRLCFLPASSEESRLQLQCVLKECEDTMADIDEILGQSH